MSALKRSSRFASPTHDSAASMSFPTRSPSSIVKEGFGRMRCDGLTPDREGARSVLLQHRFELLATIVSHRHDHDPKVSLRRMI
jgi:hypothetical protein